MTPAKKNSRNTIYLDESGVSSFKDSGRYFILTGVVSNNSEFSQLSEYYFRLKLKYFEDEKPIHSYDLFWKPTKQDISFVSELVKYLETIPFGFLTTLSEAKSLWKQNGLATEKFSDGTVEDILQVIKQSLFPDINGYYPLKISYYTLLKQYINDYSKKLSTDDCTFEICFETSPNRERIIRYTEEFYEERKKINSKERTNFAVNLKDRVYSISFPNKSAKYLGLEIADIISYGFSLSRYKRINDVPLYKDIWDIISKRRNDLKKDYNIDCVYEIPKKK